MSYKTPINYKSLLPPKSIRAKKWQKSLYQTNKKKSDGACTFLIQTRLLCGSPAYAALHLQRVFFLGVFIYLFIIFFCKSCLIKAVLFLCDYLAPGLIGN